MTTLHPSDWANLVDKFEKDDALFQKFYKSVQLNQRVHVADLSYDIICTDTCGRVTLLPVIPSVKPQPSVILSHLGQETIQPVRANFFQE